MRTICADIFGWLDSHGSAITALATVVLAVVTGAYVVLTRRLVREEYERTFLATAPMLTIQLLMDEGSPALHVRNVGVGPARWAAMDQRPRSSVAGPWRLRSPLQWVDLGPGEDAIWYFEQDQERFAERTNLPLILRFADPGWTHVIVEVFRLESVGPVEQGLYRVWRVTSFRPSEADMRRSVRWRWSLREADVGEIWLDPTFQA
jgi:hypothetical protein